VTIYLTQKNVYNKNLTKSKNAVLTHAAQPCLYPRPMLGRQIKCYSSAAGSNKSTMGPPLTPPGCGEEWKETGRNWWVGIRAF